MASRPSLVTPSERLRSRQQQVSLGEDTKVESTSRTPSSSSRWQENNGAVYNQGCLLDLDLHTTTNNFAPNEFREVVNLSGLVVYKGSNTSRSSSDDCNEKEIKAVNE